MVRQFDGKMVPKSQARNSYGGLIYGQTLEQDNTPRYADGSTEFKMFSLDAIKSRIEDAGNIIDNVKYSGKISTNPMNSVIIRTIGKDQKTADKNQEAIKTGLDNQEKASPWVQDLIDNHPLLGEAYKTIKQTGRGMGRGLFGTIKLTTDNFDTPATDAIGSWAEDQANKFLTSKVQNKWEDAPQDLKSFTEGGYKDPRFYIR